jgi:hypothetical protein
MAEGESLTLIRTVDKYSWGLIYNNFMISGQKVGLGFDQVVFDPGYPYIHLYKSDFDRLASIINTRLGFDLGYAICQKGKCVIQSSCNDINIDLYFSINILDSIGNSYQIRLAKEELLISELDENKCYLPFF